ncbi:MAG: S-layer homology domain-containing protein [Eubacteriales bacterium]|jgi:hypothetical protein
MKNRLLSILLCLCMAFTLLPAQSVLALDHQHDGISFTTEWSSSPPASIATSQNIFLSRNVALSRTLTISGQDTVVNLCLNNYSMSIPSSYRFIVESGATLNIYNCGQSESIYGRYPITVRGTVNLYSGTVTGTYEHGDAILVEEGGVLNIHDGKVENTASAAGSGATIQCTGGTVNISGGTVDGNLNRALVLEDNAVANITGGTVTSSASTPSVPTIFHTGGTLTISRPSTTVSHTGAGYALYMREGNSTPSDPVTTHITGGSITASQQEAIRLASNDTDAPNALFLSGTPIIHGGSTTAISIASSDEGIIWPKLYATAAEDSGSEAYSGGTLNVSVGMKNDSMSGQTVITNSTNESRFKLTPESYGYFLTPSGNNLVLHLHKWSADRKADETYHWFECETPGCPVGQKDKNKHFTAPDDSNCTTPILCLTCGYVLTPGESSHDLSYTAEDNVITETCQKDGCAHTGTATLKAPDSPAYDGTTEWEATVSYSGWTSGELAIRYTDGNGDPVTDLKNVGTYTASITAGGKTAQVTYTVDKGTGSAPEVQGVDTTYIDTEDGKITGVDDTMEYRKDGDTSFTPVTGTEITGLPAGKYFVRYKETENWNPSAEATVTISQGGKRPAAITLTAALDREYNGLAASVENGFTYDGDAAPVIQWYSDNGGTRGDEIQAPSDAGTYWLVITAAETDVWQAASLEKQFTIAPKTVEILWAEDDFTYNGSDQIASITASYQNVLGETVPLTVTVAGGVFQDYREGGYTAEAAFVSGETNYQLPADSTKTYHMKKADLHVTFPTATPLRYGQPLSESQLEGGSGDGTFAWADGTIIPTVVNSGYEVIFTPTNPNYNTQCQTIPVTVSKATPSYTEPTATPLRYGQPLSESQLEGGSGDGTFAWADGATIPTVDNLYGYAVHFTPTDSENYHFVTFLVPVTVTPAVPDYTIPEVTATYGQTLAELALPQGWTWDDPSQSVGTPGTNSFSATFIPEDTVNYLTVQRMIPVEVQKTYVSIMLSEESLSGEGANHQASFTIQISQVSGETPTGTVTVTFDERTPETLPLTDGWTRYSVENVPAGDHTLTIAYNGDSNYLSSFMARPLNVPKDPQRELQVTAPATEMTFGDEPFQLTVTGGSGTGAITYDIDGESLVYDEGTGKFTIVRAGTSTITVTKEADNNYHETSAQISITVAPVAPTLTTPPTVSRVRKGNLLSTAGFTGGVVTGLDGTTALEGTWTWKNDRAMTETGTFEETAIFTPTNTGYTPVEVQLEVEVYRPSSGSGGGSGNPSYAVTIPTPEHGKITSSPVNAASGTTVTLTVTPDEGYTLDSLTVTDSSGKKIEVSSIGGGQYTFTMPAALVKIQTEFVQSAPSWENCEGGKGCPLTGYTDLNTAAWYHDGIHYCLEKGLMAGTEEDRFSPDGTLTRAQMVAVLWRLENKPVVNYAMNFEDVPQGQWYSEAVRWAASEKIVEGYDDTFFGTNDAVTREQLAAILYRYAQYKGYDVSLEEGAAILSFTDSDQISSWAYEAMQWACGSKLISGNGDGTVNPTSDTRRCEFATLMMRFVENR